MAIATLHKRIFLVAIVVLPMYWLLFTEDGKRRSDTLILWMMGGDPIDINFRALDNKYSQDDWKKVYSDIDWQCRTQQTAFGESMCFSEISSYNGLPARYLSVFFDNSHTSAVKLVYRNQYHQQLGQDLQQQLGLPLHKTGKTADDDVLQWQTDHGMILIRKSLKPDEEATLIWLAQKAGK